MNFFRYQANKGVQIVFTCLIWCAIGLFNLIYLCRNFILAMMSNFKNQFDDLVELIPEKSMDSAALILDDGTSIIINPIENEYLDDRNLIPAPKKPVEQTLTRYWEAALDIGEIDLDDDFFDLGGNSLLAMKTVSRINKELGIKLAVSTIYQLPTIRQLARKIENFESEQLKSIVLLKEGVGTPLFIFPPWSSYPTIFDEFVNIYSKSNPLYGIIYSEDADDFPFKDLHEYASHLIIEIKKIHPKGPYSLLGCSMGARTILEVAMQLQNSNDKIEFLGAISHYPSYPSKGLFLNRRVRDEIRTVMKIDLRLKVKYFRHRLPHFLKLMLTGDNSVQEIIIENGAQNQILALHEIYDPKTKYNGDLVLIYERSPEGGPSELTKSQVYRNSIFKLLWKQYITGNIVEKIVECKHIDFFKKPAVNQITTIVESYTV